MNSLDIQFVFSVLARLQERFKYVDEAHLFELALIWGQVEAEIMEGIHSAALESVEGIHIDLKPEMATLQAKMDLYLADAIIDERTKGRKISEIIPDAERAFHSSVTGQRAISETIGEFSQTWVDRYKERWEPKTKAKLAREASPPTQKRRIPKEVSENHFISHFFLRDYWSFDGRLTIHDKINIAANPKSVSHGSWGWKKDLYSDQLEDRFSLIEGDAARPLQKITQSELLNDKERHAFLGYLIVQKYRSPFFRERLLAHSKQAVIEWVGEEKADDRDIQRHVFESFFQNDELYNDIAHPLFWSRWCLLKSVDNEFPLPDTTMVLGNYGGRGVALAPLSPSVCFVCSHLPEEKPDTKAALPFSVSDPAINKKVASLMMLTAEKQFLSHPEFKRFSPVKPAEDELHDICQDIEQALEPVQFVPRQKPR